MAEVLEAEATGDSGFVRRVAIKRMLGEAQHDPAFGRMFLDEARIASSLHHANVVSVLDYGMVDGTPFQVLELVDGVDGRQLLRLDRGGALPLDIALHLVVQIGHALSAAHEARDEQGRPRGIVHRDVSPGNILVSWSGDVKLADFGIAFAKDRTEKTEAGMTKGTLVYMSPEQAMTGRVDARSDIFSLGCVLHALVTGASPLAAGGLNGFLLERRTTLAEGLPADIRSILETATQYEPANRFASAAAMTEAAGTALAIRLTRDPRRRLVEYLETVRPAPVERRGRLDQLVQVEIVLEGGETVREFRSSAIPEPPLTATVPDLTPAPAPQLPSSTAILAVSPAGAPGPTRRTPAIARVLVALGAVAAFLLVGAAGARVLARMRGPKVVAPHDRAAVSASSDAAAPIADPTESAPEAITPIPPLRTVSDAPDAAKPRDSRHAKAPPVASAPPLEAACSGTMYLSCPSAPRAAVLLDGVATSLHHGEFVDVRCGNHAVAFVAPDGRRSSRSAHPTAASTRTAPVEVRCDLD